MIKISKLAKQTIDPDTNQKMSLDEKIRLVPNLPYDPDRVDTYLRDYQTTVLRKGKPPKSAAAW
jgi:hypothetical protein